LDSDRRRGRYVCATGLALLAGALACARSDAPIDLAAITPVGDVTPVWLEAVTPGQPTVTLPPPTPVIPGLPSATPRPTQNILVPPTSDATRASILDRQSAVEYVVKAGDFLSRIGEYYGVSAAEIAAANGIAVTDEIYPGQVLLIPVPNANNIGSDLKLLPDSELVYGPGSVDFNLNAFVEAYGGYLAHYTEEIPGAYLDGSTNSRVLAGAEIIQFVAERYSLSPRVLLALLEYQNGWVRSANPRASGLAFPMGDVEPGREGLYRQLTWTARKLNYGYYAWRVGSIVSWGFADGSVKLIAPGLNPGSVGIQNFFASLLGPADWDKAVAAKGFAATYRELFGNPFEKAFEPLLPADLVQPVLQLPFEPGKMWAFTGGPHAAWDEGSAWGALDFAPPADALGCVESNEWVVAAADGLIVRTGDGAVLEDLDGDGYEQTGWVLFYMHVEARDRVSVGTLVKAGDHIGHPSCEGGVSQGTHVHFVRKYNGEWIAADGPIPFVLDGWVSRGLGQEYDGLMTLGVQSIEACDCRAAGNEIARP
jgi:murein DD-endopeptidase MepM/ murein hydrolase activator NlpD